MDWHLYHAVNLFVFHHEWLADLAGPLEAVSIPLFAIATAALWLLARPGGSRRWKLAATAGLGAAAVALLVNQAVSHLWDRPRPFVTHPAAHVWTRHAADASFPSDHAAAAFAIAVAVVCFSRFAGAIFVGAAALVAAGRLVLGVHYPGDVLAGVLIGIASGLVVARFGRPLLLPVVRGAERLTDPALSWIWRFPGRRAS